MGSIHLLLKATLFIGESPSYNPPCLLLTWHSQNVFLLRAVSGRLHGTIIMRPHQTNWPKKWIQRIPRDIRTTYRVRFLLRCLHVRLDQIIFVEDTAYWNEKRSVPWTQRGCESRKRNPSRPLDPSAQNSHRFFQNRCAFHRCPCRPVLFLQHHIHSCVYRHGTNVMLRAVPLYDKNTRYNNSLFASLLLYCRTQEDVYKYWTLAYRCRHLFPKQRS